MAAEARSRHGDPETRLLAGLADPVRLDMLRQLASDGEVCGCGFRVLDRVAQPTVSHHLRVLREAGLVKFEREHSYLRYRLDSEGLARVAGIVERLRPPATSTDDVPPEAELTVCCGAGRSR